MATVVRFELDGHAFGLLARDVREILRAAAVSPLPGAPPVVAGTLNVRGTIVPVFDIRSRFSLAPRPVVPSDHLVLADAGRPSIIAVDRVEGLVEVPDADLASDLPAASPAVRGVARMPDGTLVLLDLARFLTDAEAAALDEALG